MKSNQEIQMVSKWRFRAMALALSLGASVSAMAQNAIQAISSSQQAGSDVVRIEMSEALAAVPAGFAIQTPPRIAIDLPGVSNALGKSSVEINQGNLRSVNIAQSGERTRLVLNLKKAANYRAELQGKVLLLVLDGTPPPAATAAATTAATATGATTPTEPIRFAESLNRSPLALKDIDFRRGADGAGRVIVELANNQVGVDIRQQGQTLVVDFLRSTLPENLRRRLDVTDFGTPVQSVTTTQSGDRVRMVVEPRGNWQHSAYQSDNQFVLEVRPQVVDPNKLVQGVGFTGERLSLNFQNIEVRALLQVIADFTNFNVVTSDTVTGNVTLRLKDVPWDQALDIILQAKGLGLRKSGNVILIAPKDELNTKEKVELEAKGAIAALEPLRSQAFQLNYARAKDVVDSILGQVAAGQAATSSQGSNSGRILSPRGTAIYDARTNQLFVQDIPSKLEEVQAMIAKIDVAIRQVMIEARIVIAEDSFSRSLGVRLGGSDLGLTQANRQPGYNVGSNGNRVALGGSYNALSPTTGQPSGTSFNYGDGTFVNLPAAAQNGFNVATFALSLFSPAAQRFLNLEISALEADGKGKVVSSPRVITADQQKALIEQGEELPYQVATSSGATSIQFRKANLKLEVTPQITPEGNVILNVDITKDSVGRITTAGFAIDTKHVNTQVLVENGGTVVIGGIFDQSENTEVAGVPLLKDIPYLGYLFKNTTKQTKRTELLIFLTPKVLTDRNAAR